MALASNIYRLGIKELWSLLRDPIMLVLIAYSFTFQVYIAATAMPRPRHWISPRHTGRVGLPRAKQETMSVPPEMEDRQRSALMSR